MATGLQRKAILILAFGKSELLNQPTSGHTLPSRSEYTQCAQSDALFTGNRTHCQEAGVTYQQQESPSINITIKQRPW